MAQTVKTVEAVYEKGVLRLKEPVSLVDGETVDVLVVPRARPRPADEASENEVARHRDGDMSQYYDPDAAARLRSLPRPDPAEVARRLREIAARAPQRDQPEDASENHNRYLYGPDPA